MRQADYNKRKKMPLKTRGLTPKEKAFADAFIETDNATEAVRRVYGRSIKNTQSNLGKKGYLLVRNANVQEYIKGKAQLAGETMVSLLESKQDSIKFQSARDILDRTLGKATETVNVNSDTKHLEVHSINVLMQSLAGGFQNSNAPVIEDKAPLNAITEQATEQALEEGK